MDWRELIVDGYDRLPDLMKNVLAGSSPGRPRPAPHHDSNSLGWTAWHLTRVQDRQFADLMGAEQSWIEDGWHVRFSKPRANGLGEQAWGGAAGLGS